VKDDESAYKLQTKIATELNAEISIAAPIAGDDEGALVISAFVYNHPREFERFAADLAQFFAQN
jgi:hypothetical protein